MDINKTTKTVFVLGATAGLVYVVIKDLAPLATDSWLYKICLICLCLVIIIVGLSITHFINKDSKIKKGDNTK